MEQNIDASAGRQLGRVAVAVGGALVIAVGAAACSDAKDTAGSATSGIKSAATDATDRASSAVAGAASTSAEVLQSPTASAPAAAPVPSTSIQSPTGTAISIADPAVITEYAARGYERGYLGKPLGPVVALPTGGKFITFEGGSIYVNPASSTAYTVHGAIGGYWGTTGHETGKLGYPAGEETANGSVLEQKYDGGTLRDTDGVVSIAGS